MWLSSRLELGNAHFSDEDHTLSFSKSLRYVGRTFLGNILGEPVGR